MPQLLSLHTYYVILDSIQVVSCQFVRVECKSRQDKESVLHPIKSLFIVVVVFCVHPSLQNIGIRVVQNILLGPAHDVAVGIKFDFFEAPRAQLRR